jgi:hypothetical protein
MKAASSAPAGPNDAIAKSATSALLTILTASSRFGHQISELYADIRQMAEGQIAILRHSYVSSKPKSSSRRAVDDVGRSRHPLSGTKR